MATDGQDAGAAPMALGEGIEALMDPALAAAPAAGNVIQIARRQTRGRKIKGGAFLC